MIFFSRTHVKRAETSNQRDPGGAKPFTASDEHNPSGKWWCLFHLIDILLFLLSEELLESRAIEGQDQGQVYSQGKEMQIN